MRDQDWDDYVKGLGGTPTGSPIGYQGMIDGGHVKRPGSLDPLRDSVPSGQRRAPGYQPLPFTRKLLDAIPRWLLFALAAAGAMAGMGFADNMDPELGAWRLLPSVVLGFAGYIAPTLIISLVDFLVQLAIGLIKLALILGLVGGFLYGIYLMLP